MHNKNNISVSRLLGLLWLLLITASCTTTAKSEEEVRADRYSECETLADTATSLELAALSSGETNYSSPEWKAYDQARDRYNILNCREWWPLPYS